MNHFKKILSEIGEWVLAVFLGLAIVSLALGVGYVSHLLIDV